MTDIILEDDVQYVHLFRRSSCVFLINYRDVSARHRRLFLTMCTTAYTTLILSSC